MSYNLLHKTFSSSLFKDKFFLEKYFLSSNVYAKYYIKVIDNTTIFNKEIKLYTLDNTFNNFNISFNKRRNRSRKKLNSLNLKLGSSLGLNFFKFRNRFSDHWSFKSLLPTCKFRITLGTARLFRFFKSINSKKFYSFFFLRPNKGGHLIYSNNAVCFLPNSHFKFTIAIFAKSMKNQKLHKNIIVLHKLLLKRKKIRLFIPIRFPYKIFQISFWKLGKIRHNFNLSKKRKRRRHYSKFRLVAVYKQRKKKLNKKFISSSVELKKPKWISKSVSKKNN
jgi:hypothetical protein